MFTFLLPNRQASQVRRCGGGSHPKSDLGALRGQHPAPAFHPVLLSLPAPLQGWGSHRALQ